MSGPLNGPPPCPDDLRLASFLEARLAEEEQRAIRRHLVDCAACRAAVTSILHSLAALDESPLTPLPEAIRRQVADLVPSNAGGASATRRVPLARRALLAAAALLAVFAVAKFGLRAPAPKPNQGAGAAPPNETPEMRGAISETFTTLFPKDQALLAVSSPAALVLEWSAYGGHDAAPESASADERVSYYVATVLDRSGRIVWSGRTAATSISPPDSARIVPGATYTWSVVAHLTFGTSQETRSAMFTVSR